jgi:putative membrane protein
MKKQPMVMAVLLTASIFTITSGHKTALSQPNLIPIQLTQNNVRQRQQQFITKVAQGNLAEIELGRLGEHKAESNEVKQFARLMVTAHTRLNQEIQDLAHQKGATFPSDIGKENKRIKTNLEKLSGANFDKAYIQQIIAEYNKNIALYRRQSQKSDDKNLKNWAAKNLPLLQEHLRLARSIQDNLTESGRK